MTPPRKKVLVVEDDPAIRKLVFRHLRSLNVEVIETADAKSAFAQLSQWAPDLLCLDLMLPDQSGYVLCEHVQKTPALSRVPILVITARTSVADRAHAEEFGVAAYLTKPFSRAEFIERAQGLLEREM
jgi:two-component system chemotaxis response regulator CheY